MADRPSWEAVWMGVADQVALRSRCSRAKVGACVVSHDQRVLALSYNGPPRGFQAEGSCINWCPRARAAKFDPVYDDCPSVHAESNAIARTDFTQMAGSTIYVTTSICKGCAKIVANSGIERVVYRVAADGSDAHRNPSLTDDFLYDCGLTVVHWEAAAHATTF